MAIAKKSAAAGRAPARATATRTAPAAPPPAAATAGLVSFNPDTFTSGGLIDDVDIEITDAVTLEWDYNGQQAASPALAIEYTDPTGTAVVQYYSIGKAEDWKADPTGEGFVSVSGKTGFNNNSNLGMWVDSLVKAGFPKEHLNVSAKTFIGIKAHVLRQVTERKGLIRQGPRADQPTSTLLISKLYAYQVNGKEVVVGAGGHTAAAAGGRANGAAAPNPGTTAAAPTGSNDVDDVIVGALVGALVESPVLDKKEVVKLVFKACTDQGKDAKFRNQCVIRAGQQDFLKSLASSAVVQAKTEELLGAPQNIAYDGSSLSFAE